MYHFILVPFDGSDTSERGVREAIRIAAATRARLVLLNVIDDCPTMREFASTEPFDDMRSRRRHTAEELLDRAARWARERHIGVECQVRFAVESIAASIVQAAHDRNCELIVLGTHGRGGVKRALMGSVAEELLRHSPVPVLLVPPDRGARLREAA